MKKRNFKELLINAQTENNNNIIAEIKKASPSAGVIIEDYEPEKLAIKYEQLIPVLIEGIKEQQKQIKYLNGPIPFLYQSWQ